jgi:hypothetical protein
MSVIRAFARPIAWDTVAEDARNLAEEKGWPALGRLAEEILAAEYAHKRHLVDTAFEKHFEALTLKIDGLLKDRNINAETFFGHLLMHAERLRELE